MIVEVEDRPRAVRVFVFAIFGNGSSFRFYDNYIVETKALVD